MELNVCDDVSCFKVPLSAILFGGRQKPGEHDVNDNKKQLVPLYVLL